MQTTQVNQKQLSDAELDQTLMECINEYVSDVKHPCSFDVLAEDILLEEELLRDERCVVVAMPQRMASEFPATDANYGAVVMTRPDDLRQANLMLRGEKIALPLHPYYAMPHLKLGRLLVVYQFADVKILETIPMTPELYDDLCICDLTAQSKNHPTFAELEAMRTGDSADRLVHVLDNRTVTRRKSGT